MAHVAILVHRYDLFKDAPYFLYEISKMWEEEGIRVTVLQGPDTYVPADAIFLHVDLTVVPVDHRIFARRYPVAINLHAVDCSKRVVSRHLLEPNSPWRGRVIIKTDLNSMGIRETQLASQGRFPQDQAFLIREYPILDSLKEVPAQVWANRHLVVEKFQPEMIDGFYCLRTWMFLGSGETNSLSYSIEPIVKASTVVKREALDDVPLLLRELREELGFDFGKFDYALVDGEVVLYDANRTPTLGAFSREQVLPRLRPLAAGLQSLLSAS